MENASFVYLFLESSLCLFSFSSKCTIYGECKLRLPILGEQPVLIYFFFQVHYIWRMQASSTYSWRAACAYLPFLPRALNNLEYVTKLTLSFASVLNP